MPQATRGQKSKRWGRWRRRGVTKQIRALRLSRGCASARRGTTHSLQTRSTCCTCSVSCVSLYESTRVVVVRVDHQIGRIRRERTRTTYGDISASILFPSTSFCSDESIDTQAAAKASARLAFAISHGVRVKA